MSKTIFIDKENFTVLEKEFNKVYHEEFCNLNILESLGLLERIVSLINELNYLDKKMNLLCFEVSHGGFIPIKTCLKYENVYILNDSSINDSNIIENIGKKNISNIKLVDSKKNIYKNSSLNFQLFNKYL